MPELFEKVRKFVDKSYNGKTVHFERTVYWIRQLKPKADGALLIAGLAHDIERAFREDWMWELPVKRGFRDSVFLRHHQERGAKIIGEFLKKEGADRRLIERVKMLVSRHEEGGNDDQNVLKDADSISMLENNVKNFIKRYVPAMGKEIAEEKFDWMYNRITSKKAKRIAKPWYEKAIKKLESASV